ncbi:MAG: TonB-dependent receptor plug domain-containing protein, partial [Wenzhouxiangella sp.]|nr:TonB-dependent receptor plug domain-containing protein [Wenzhouxiangella sp.]
MRHAIPLAGLLLGIPLGVSAQPDDPDRDSLDLGDPIVVTADFRPIELFELGGSTTVIDGETIDQRGATHIDRILALAPNVNISTGASRGRFFQIRGIGERSQFVEPLNPSVGLIVDGIDLTGIGGAATTLDIVQAEILRGPQGTLFGANALAGMINLVSAGPTERAAGHASLRLGERDTRQFEGAFGGPISETLGYRIAYANVHSDGSQRNAFLNTDDNQNIDEQTLRTRVRWQPGDQVTLDLTGLYLDIDNGYDGFSLDNTRTTLSDDPGHDRQETLAGSARLRWQAGTRLDIEALVSHARADLEYGFDEDWSFDGLCEVFE